jgi:hypothetical protein
MDNQLTINDIVQIKNIIDICSKRGAFQAGELETVGAIYNRIKKFTDEIEDRAKEQQEEQAKKENKLETVQEDPTEGANISMNVAEN